MPSAIDSRAAGETRPRPFVDRFTLWNRKLHYYLGLYFLFFVWLFAFTGLLLNHGAWRFFEFWPNRKVSTFERPIEPPSPGADRDRARDLMRQLAIDGEISWPNINSDPRRLAFRVSRPGQTFEIQADLDQRRAKIERTAINGWGTMRVIHIFTGVRWGDPKEQRDWILTTVWAISMDALAIGLIVMVLGSYYMWYVLKPKRRWGLVALGLGLASCGWFVFGVRWIYS